jgi:hypothetical protein
MKYEVKKGLYDASYYIYTSHLGPLEHSHGDPHHVTRLVFDRSDSIFVEAEPGPMTSVEPRGSRILRVMYFALCSTPQYFPGTPL